MKKRVFLIVLDSCGAGQMPDCSLFGDRDCHTIKRISTSEKFSCENLRKMGIGNIDGLDFLGTTDTPTARVARLAESSKGKDTTIGHWEIAGIISETPLPTYPHGFPKEILDEFTTRTGKRVLCNLPYSGTDVIRDYGEEHLQTGKLIIYTSADSVFQIAAHEEKVPVPELYRVCEIARDMLTNEWNGSHAVGRVIARPFEGEAPFKRTARRHDYSILPPAPTMLDAIKNAGLDSIAVGKITDIFVGQGVTETIRTANNAEGMAATSKVAERDFRGLCFTNLVDFDMVYGHRNNIEGYATALTEFDKWLADFLPTLGENDLLIVTADHGCDPATPSTDHSREYTPMLMYRKGMAGKDLGTRKTFADIAATVADFLGVDASGLAGESFLGR